MIIKTKSTINIFYLCIILFTSVQTFAQTSWQQRVDYDISVKLDDINHTLSGKEKMIYTNNSTQTLSFIYIHLYANAYKDRTTALAKELIADRRTGLYFADEKDRGFIDSLAFTVDGITAKYELVDKNIDIAKLYLNTPLLPNNSIKIETPFFVKIPGNFSRLSHVGQSYQICQWYPKPAVFDKNGWHQMPYHDQGEFFSEFGSYKVSISLPENYIVGATGILQEKSEQDFINNLANDSIENIDDYIYFPKSSKNYKTITYIQDSIHDFAWFADKRFIVRKSEVQLPVSKRKVTTYAFFTGQGYDLWLHATDFVNRSIAFYSKNIGEYPYDVYTAIDGTLSAGGGMEYPMITNINTPGDLHELDIVITHEVGHSWFYGILASNERDEPWLDEGVNSFYENMYNNTYYPDEKLYKTLINSKKIAKILGIYELDDSYKNKLFYQYQAATHRDQAINLKSREYTNENYGAVVYSKTPLALEYIRQYMGKSAFENAMKSYFINYQFKHPSSIDFQNELQKFCKMDLSNLFNELIYSKSYQNTSIKNIKNSKSNTININLKNKNSKIPFPISFGNVGENNTIWYDTNKISIKNNTIQSVSLFNKTDNINSPFNNEKYIWKNNKFIREQNPVVVKMIGIVRAPNQRQLNILPAIGWNQADKFMIGLLFYNCPIPSPKFEYQLAPMFATGSLKPVGMGRISYHIYPNKIYRITLSLKAQSFAYKDYYISSIDKTKWLSFYNAQPSIKFVFKNKSIHSPITKYLQLMSSIVYQEFESDFTASKKVGHLYQTAEVKFNLLNTKKINPYEFNFSLQGSSDFASINTTAKYNISYNKARNTIEFRLFTGVFLFKKSIAIDLNKGFLPPNRSLTLSSNPLIGNFVGKMNEDFTYESIYLDRSGSTNVLSHQVFTNKEGGFRSMIGTGLGNSDKWILSLNVSASLLKRIPIKPFVSVGTGYLFSYKENTYKHGVFIAEAGFSIVGIKDVFEIHFPLLVTNNIKENQKFNFGIDKFYERITFTLDLNLLNPFEKIRNLKF